uniref:GNAT family N-acetyltransferase n=1 Tax=Vibrio vulnificus TaxID=672 RepID=UPI0030EF0681
ALVLLRGNSLNIRKAELRDLSFLVEFTSEEAREAENAVKIPETLKRGIEAALRDRDVASYWVMTDENDIPIGSVSSIREWSDWNAGYYWWIQSMYLRPEYRGKGLMSELITCVESEMYREGGLELRLYVHKDNVVAKRAYEKSGFSFSDYQIMVLSKEH